VLSGGQGRRHGFLGGEEGVGPKPWLTKPTPKIKNSPDVSHSFFKRANLPFHFFIPVKNVGRSSISGGDIPVSPTGGTRPPIPPGGDAHALYVH